jgi:hypothetical protein
MEAKMWRGSEIYRQKRQLGHVMADIFRQPKHQRANWMSVIIWKELPLPVMLNVDTENVNVALAFLR